MKTGHFYFGKKRTFLNWFDKLWNVLDNQRIIVVYLVIISYNLISFIIIFFYETDGCRQESRS